MKILYTLGLLCLLLTVSCNVDERVIDNSVNNTKMFFIRDSQPGMLGAIELPLGAIISEDIYYEKNNESLGSKIYNVVSNYNQMYIFLPEAHKIVIVNPETYKKITELDFTQDSLEPIDICFPNPTDGYIAFRNYASVYLLDLGNNQISRKMAINGNVSDIDGDFTNQIFVANPDMNTVSIIDSRSHKQEATINVAPVPALVKMSLDKKLVFVVSIGNGKTNNGAKSAAVLSIINVDSRTVTKTVEIGTSSGAALDEIPVSLAVSTDRILFIATKTCLYRFDYKAGSSIARIKKDNFMSMIYNGKENQLLFIVNPSNQVQAIIGDPKTGSYNTRTDMSNDLSGLFIM